MALRIGTFLSPRFLPLYEASASVIGETLHSEVELVTHSRFGELARGELDFAFLCGLPYVNLRDGGAAVEPLVAPVRAEPRYGGEPRYFSDVVVRRGSDGARIEDFERLAVNEPDSHSGWSIVLAALEERGVPVGGFTEVRRTGGHEASLAAVREGEADVAAIDSHVLARLRADDPSIDTDIEVIEALGPSPSQPVAASPEIRPRDREAVRAALGQMTGTPMRWFPVTDATYDPIRAMRDRATARGAF